MTAVDKELRVLRARCRPYLARLALLARRPPGMPLPSGTAGEVTEAARAVLAQAEAAGRLVVSATADGRQAAKQEFLAARLARLEAAADAAITAARRRDATALRTRLRQFDALTTALWTVHQAVSIPSPRAPVPGSPHGARPGRE